MKKYKLIEYFDYHFVAILGEYETREEAEKEMYKIDNRRPYTQYDVKEVNNAIKE